MRRLLFLTTLIASPAFAEDAALLLGVTRYEEVGRVTRDNVTEAAGPFARTGFETFVGTGASAADMALLADQFKDVSRSADRLVVGLSGVFVTSADGTWLMGADATEPVTTFTAPQNGISVDAVIRLLGQTPGQSIVVIGAADVNGQSMGRDFFANVGSLDAPQGTLIAIGEPGDAVDFLNKIAVPGADVIRAAEDIELLGYVPRSLILVPADAVEIESAPQTVDTAAEDALWQGAQALDTSDAYLDYLSKYPNGQYIDEAQAQIDAINSEPNRQDRLAEEGLNLTRDQRRDIQRDLTVLDYNTRGIDGIFGPGSRSAITNWQQQTGFAQTSYLTSDQINQLDAQAARRSAEIEAEAARARAEEERRDRAFWQETGAAGDEPGYRAYLDRYPEGLFASEARTRLGAIEADTLAAAETEDKIGWDRARSTDTIPGYREYLAAFEEGSFRRAARDRIKEIRREANDAQAAQAAEATEVELNVDRLTAQLIEGKLLSLGLNPGAADGEFTDDTRQALRRYQRDRDLPVSGFLDEGTVSRLLADTLQGISR